MNGCSETPDSLTLKREEISRIAGSQGFEIGSAPFGVRGCRFDRRQGKPVQKCG